MASTTARAVTIIGYCHMYGTARVCAASIITTCNCLRTRAASVIVFWKLIDASRPVSQLSADLAYVRYSTVQHAHARHQSSRRVIAYTHARAPVIAFWKLIHPVLEDVDYARNCLWRRYLPLFLSLAVFFVFFAVVFLPSYRLFCRLCRRFCRFPLRLRCCLRRHFLLSSPTFLPSSPSFSAFDFVVFTVFCRLFGHLCRRFFVVFVVVSAVFRYDPCRCFCRLRRRLRRRFRRRFSPFRRRF